MSIKKDPFSEVLNLSIIKFIILTPLTCGLYYIYVQNRLNMLAVKYGNLKLARKAMNAYGFAMTFWLIGLWLVGAGAVTYTFEVIVAGVGVFVLGCFGNLRWAYVFRRIISLHHRKEYKIEYTPNGFLLFFFQAFLLVWAINRTDKRVKKHNKNK